jgi:hypothetical protein
MNAVQVSLERYHKADGKQLRFQGYSAFLPTLLYPGAKDHPRPVDSDVPGSGYIRSGASDMATGIETAFFRYDTDPVQVIDNVAWLFLP